MDNLLVLQKILDGERDGDVDAFLVFLKKEGLDLLAAYRAIKDDEVRASLRKLILNIARPATYDEDDGGPTAA